MFFTSNLYIEYDSIPLLNYRLAFHGWCLTAKDDSYDYSHWAEIDIDGPLQMHFLIGHPHVRFAKGIVSQWMPTASDGLWLDSYWA